jgi:cold shock CspA family protein
MQHGYVVTVNLDRGYCFLRCDSGGEDVFAHAGAFRGGLEFDEKLQEKRVTFDRYKTDRGWKAANVRPADSESE